MHHSKVTYISKQKYYFKSTTNIKQKNIYTIKNKYSKYTNMNKLDLQEERRKLYKINQTII